MVNDRSNASSAFMVNDDRSLGSQGFNITTGQSTVGNRLGQNPSMSQFQSKASLDYNLSQSADSLSGTVIKNPGGLQPIKEESGSTNNSTINNPNDER